MLYNKPFDQTNPAAGYINGNPATNTAGSIPCAEGLEYPQREIVAVIAAAQPAGLDAPSNTDLNQMLQAIRSGLLNRFVGTGTADAIAIAPQPVYIALVEGMRFSIKIPGSAANATTAPTLTVNTIAVPILRRDGSAIVPGDIVGGMAQDFIIDAFGNARLAGLGLAEVPRLAPAGGVLLWVRTDGSDGNDGFSNTPGRAFRTLAAALSYGTSKFALQGASLTIAFGVGGTYDAPGRAPTAAGSISIVGDQSGTPTNQDAYAVQGVGSAGGGGGLMYAIGGVFSLRGLRLSNTGTINHTLNASSGAFVNAEYVTLEALAGGGFFHAQTASGATIYVGPGCKASGSMAGLGAAVNGGTTRFAKSFLVANGPTWSLAGLYAAQGYVSVEPGATISGPANGPQYVGVDYGVIGTFGQGTGPGAGNQNGTLTNASYH